MNRKPVLLKKLFAGILTVALCTGNLIFPMPVFAADSAPESWGELQSELQDGETVVLTENIVCEDQTLGPLTVPEGVTASIDLNGYTIDRNLDAAADNGSVFVVNGTLTIKDGSEEKTGTITGGYNADRGGGFSVTDGGRLAIEGGTITECTAGYGGGLYVNNGTVTMTDGKLDGNTAIYNGGGVANVGGSVLGTEGRFEMTGGVISGNKAGNGGGIYMLTKSSVVSLSGGEISGNSANLSESQGLGGAIFVNTNGILTIAGCHITGNTGKTTGGVHVSFGKNAANKLSLGADTVVTGNTDGNGKPSNLYLESQAKLTILSGEDAPDDMSVGISAASAPTEAPVQISDASAGLDALSYFTSDSGEYGLIHVDGVMKLSLAGKCGVTYVSEHGTAPAAIIVEQASLLTKPADPAEENYVFLGWYKDSAFTEAWDFENDKVTDSLILYGKWEKSAWVGLQESLSSGTNVTLSRDIICDNQAYGPLTVPEGVTASIDLNGYTIDRNLDAAADNGSVFVVNGTLTIKDGSAGKTGTITGGYNADHGGGFSVTDGGRLAIEGGTITECTAGYGGGLYVNNGTVTMTDGKLDGNTAIYNGGGVANVGGSVLGTEGRFEMTGGVISGNKAGNGGGIYMMTKSSVVSLSGGEISGNSANLSESQGLGGAIFVNTNGILTIAGCHITGNTGKTTGGVHVSFGKNAANKLSLGADTVITGNTDGNGNASNLYQEDPVKFTILDGEYAPNGMSVGISASESPTAETRVQVSDASMQESYINCFFSDNDDFMMERLESILYLSYSPDTAVRFQMNGHGTQIEKQTVAKGGKATKPDDPTAAGWVFGGWYKEADCTNAWSFDTEIVNTRTTLYAKWTEILTGTVTVSGTAKYGEMLTAGVTDTNNTGTLSYQWSRAGTAISDATGSTYTLTADDISKSITVSVSSSVEAGTLTSSSVNAEKADGPAAPTGLTGIACRTSANNDGKITGTTAAMEYSTDSTFATKTACTGTAIAGLTNGTYYVRIAESATHKVGAAVTVVVGAYNPSPFNPGPADLDSFTVPVSGEETSVNVKVTVSGETAAVQPIKEEDIEKVIGDDVETGVVEIDLSGLKQEVTGVKLPTKMVESIAEAAGDPENDTDGLKLIFTSGALEFDAKALETIVEAAGDAKNIEIRFDNVGTTRLNADQKAAVSEMVVVEGFEAYVTVNGKRVSDFEGGSAVVYIPYVIPEDHDPAAYTVWYVADDGTMEKMDSTYDGTNHRFVVTHFSDYIVTYDEDYVAPVGCPKDETCLLEPFTDTKNDEWWHDGIHFCLENGIMVGMPDNKFEPEGDVTRAQIVTMLWRLEGEPVANYAMDFEDVAEEQWYTEAVRWAAAEKIVNGFDNTTFAPNAPITREQLATILYRYAQYKGQGFTGSWMFLLDFVDRADVSEWADEAVHWCSMKGVVNGKDGKVFDPQGTATRAEAASMVQRFCEALEK